MQEKQNPIGHLQTDYGDGGDQAHTDNFTAHLAVGVVDVWASACIRAIANWVSSIPLLVQKRTRVEGQLQYQTIDEGDLYDLLHSPNPDESWLQIECRWITGGESAGNGYLIYDDQDKELYTVQPDWIKVTADARGKITGYSITHKGLKFHADRDHIIHLKYPNPTGAYYGIPPSKVIEKQIMTKLSMNEYFKSYFTNNAMLGAVFSTDQPLNEDETQSIMKRLRRLYGGASNAGKFAVLGQGAKLDTPSRALKDLVPAELNKIIRMETLAAYGVPPIMVGDLDQASYASANVERKVFVENKGLPLLRLIESVLDLQLVPLFYGVGSEYRVFHDRNEIPSLQEDQNAKSQRVCVEWKSNIRRLNETRETLGLEPDEDYGAQYFGDLYSMGMPLSEGGNADESKTLASVDKLVKSPLNKKRHHNLLLSKERKFFKLVKEFFEDERKRVLDAIDNVTAKGLVMSMLYFFVKGTIDDDDVKKIFDLEAEKKALRDATDVFIADTIKDAGQSGVNEFNVSMQFNVKQPEVYNMIERFHNRMDDISDTTYNQLKGLIKESYTNGETIDQLTKKINDTYDIINSKKGRAKRIALTETNGMVSGANLAGAKQAGATHKVWGSSFLPTSRDWHMDADGQKVRIDEVFVVGASMMQYPGDPSGAAEDVINCHCYHKNIMEIE